jgi:hypothetical protein
MRQIVFDQIHPSQENLGVASDRGGSNDFNDWRLLVELFEALFLALGMLEVELRIHR